MELPNVTENIKSLPRPPFVDVSGIPNFRDIGGFGLTPLSTHSIRRGLVYRCGDPGKATEEGISTLKQLGVTHMYDLRSSNEIQKSHSAGRKGGIELPVTRVFSPVFSDVDYGPEAIAIRYRHYMTGGTQGFTRAYSDILEAAPPSYRSILLHLAAPSPSPIIVHCTAGKDRTGVICALILSACGVDDKTVAYEYSLTELGLGDIKEEAVTHLVSIPALECSRREALNMISAKAGNMLATLSMIRAKYGSAEGYFINECQLTTSDVQKIRQNLVASVPSIFRIPAI